MAVYSFALSTGDKLCNGQGWHLVTNQVAHQFAASIARDIKSDAVKTCVLDLNERIDVLDENGAARFSVSFRDALEVRGCSGQQGQHK